MGRSTDEIMELIRGFVDAEATNRGITEDEYLRLAIGEALQQVDRLPDLLMLVGLSIVVAKLDDLEGVISDLRGGGGVPGPVGGSA